MTEPQEREPRRARRARLALAAIIPGSAQLLRRRWSIGLPLLAVAIVMVATLFFSFDLIRAAISDGDAGDWVALLTLAAGTAAVWSLSIGMEARGSEAGGRRGEGQWAIAWAEFRRNKAAVIGLYLLLGLALATLLAPLLTAYDPNAIGDVAATRHSPPSWTHILGTDEFGRDVLTRVLYGARISLSIGLVAVAISVTLGTAVGAAAGYYGGAIDTTLMRLVDMLISFPRLVLLITVIAVFERSITLVILVLGLTLWPSTARIVRAEVLSLREREFVQAARALGLGGARIIYRHIVPNVLGPVIVAATLGIGNVILIEAGLSFLSMSVPPPDPSWGTMIYDGREYLLQAWWVATFPGLAIVFTVVSFNLIGDGLRDALDPRLRT